MEYIKNYAKHTQHINGINKIPEEISALISC